MTASLSSMNNILDLFCLPVEDATDEPTTSSSSEGSECPSDGATPNSEPFDFLAQLLSNSPRLPVKRKGRTLAETVEILKKQKEAEVEQPSPAESPVESPSPCPTPTTSLVAFNLPVFGPNGHAAAERLASMVVKEKEQQLAAVISYEKEKEVKNQIKQMTNQITAEVAPNSPDDDKRFACQICNKKFANKFLLNKHIFIHTGLRPHQCPDCHKSFNRKDNLLRHRKTHTVPLKEDRSSLINPLLLAAVAPGRTELSGSTTPESLLMTLFAAHQQQQV